jgi:hypothetical protein
MMRAHEVGTMHGSDQKDRLESRDRKVVAAEDLSDRYLEAIRDAKVPDEYAYLNEELKNWKP